MDKQELIERIEGLNKLYGDNKNYVSYDDVLNLVKQLDEPQPIKLRDVTARIKQLDIGTRKVWLDEFLNELGSDYGTMKNKDGYEQGKLEGSLIPYKEPEKVVVSEEEAKFLETFDFNCESDVTTALFHVSRTGWGYYLKDNNGIDLKDLSERFGELENRKRLIKAILDGYEVEKEKKYIVKLKNVRDIFGILNFSKRSKEWHFSDSNTNNHHRTTHTRKELEDANFGWVFDCEGIEIEEVEG